MTEVMHARDRAANSSAKIRNIRGNFSMLTGRKLALTLAFSVLVALAFGAGCQGFFPPNVLETIQIQPPTLNLGISAQQQFTAFGTYEDGTRSQVTSGLVWTSNSPSVTITNGGL